jgi:hypothetical protein
MPNNLSIKDGAGATKTLATIDLGADVHVPKHAIVDETGANISAANPLKVATTDGADVAQGARADAAATTDTGTFSLVALVKRGLSNWTTLLTRVPAQALPGLLPVDTLAGIGVARLIAMGATSVNLALSTTTRRVSIHATVAGFYAVGTGAQTASATTHYIGAGERLDFDVAANTQIAAIRATADGTLYISELTAP